MLEEKVKEVIKRFGLEDEKAITFGHPKMKTKWILPLPGVTVYSFEQFQPFFIYFDKEGISFFPLIMEDEIQLQLENDKIEMKITKSKAMNNWIKINNTYLIEHNHFYI